MTASRIVLTGATGFIGQHLLRVVRGREVFALTRDMDGGPRVSGNIKWVVGDVGSATSWQSLLVPGCTVINLAYPGELSLEQSISAAQVMVSSCAEAPAARLIHCSTVSVYGRTSGGFIDESMLCNPQDEYGYKKLAIEEAIRTANAGACEVVILRPAAVFGIGGQNLVTLVNTLCRGPSLANYLRLSLFGRRKMHLVPVQTVVDALLFLANYEHSIAGQVLNIADDGHMLNNFQDVERILREALELPARRFPPLPVPSVLLRALLRLRGRSELDPNCSYRAEKIDQMGFVRSIEFGEALRSFAMQCKSERALRRLV